MQPVKNLIHSVYSSVTLPKAAAVGVTLYALISPALAATKEEVSSGSNFGVMDFAGITTGLLICVCLAKFCHREPTVRLDLLAAPQRAPDPLPLVQADVQPARARVIPDFNRVIPNPSIDLPIETKGNIVRLRGEGKTYVNVGLENDAGEVREAIFRECGFYPSIFSPHTQQPENSYYELNYGETMQQVIERAQVDLARRRNTVILAICPKNHGAPMRRDHTTKSAKGHVE
ncbi:MAG: hypothetical protein Q8K75_01720 [Chlamydiales bacterium]|nr:hypothetical protein [Chlamydiales bacterium]